MQSERSPVLSVSSLEQRHDQQTVSVKDMDFELVKPSLPRSPLAMSSVESLPFSRQSPGDDSASIISSAKSLRQPSTDQTHPEINSAQPPDPTDIAAHRQRELRWISTMSSVSASQARKSRKVRKLVLEGVPASVRYLVWAHLTDSKAKRLDGLYPRLCQRQRVASFADIERDAARIFSEQPLQKQSLVNVLQSYLSMVPDVQYCTGLAAITGQLLVQSPEEDAFWTLVSMMDIHLRPLFSPQSVRLDVDASLFAKTLESLDAPLARRIFVDMALPPVSICKHWFTSLFVDTLPTEYLHRAWDVFLFEGVSFMIRMGLALISCRRTLLLQAVDRERTISLLGERSTQGLPPTPDALIELALSLKVNDDDLRKQRAKLEAQVKRQTQSRANPAALPRGSVSISLPKA
ncbi:RabGAP/TBC [Wolfiporia cocos MD-104 SS10]|uniref:RabGAP/TBC n=1 Tax=Wolfiporia cocos (strain MD-104) TaxID=742152 RepID=A0A2H3ISB3_WOLCO|nr:RabGAP/TBC [Wolfiporia cocos MD-104 SS10]